MAEYPGLEGAPFVAFISGRGRQQEPEIVASAEFGQGRKSLHRTALAPRTALSYQEIGIARVHNEMVFVGANGIQNLAPQGSPVESRVLQGEVGVLPLHVAVSGVKHIQ